MTVEELLESLKTDKLTNNLHLDGDLDVGNNTEKNSREAILGANAKGTKEFSHLDPIPFINKLKQCYSDLTKTVAGTTSARTDSIKMNRDFMDYTGERGEDEEETPGETGEDEEETPGETAEELEFKAYLELAEAMDLNGDGYIGLEESRVMLAVYLEEMMGNYNTETYFNTDSRYRDELVIPGYPNREPVQLNGLYYYLIGEGDVSKFKNVRPYIYESPLENEKSYEDCTTLSELSEVLAAKINKIKERTDIDAQLAARILSGVVDYGNGIYMTYEQSVDWLKTFIEIHIEPEKTVEDPELRAYLKLAEAMDLNGDGYVGLEESNIVLGVYFKEIDGNYNIKTYFDTDSEYRNELVIPGYLNRVPIQRNGLYYYLVGEGEISTFGDVRPYIYEPPLKNGKGYKNCTTLSELAKVLATKISRIKEKTNVNAKLAARISSGVADYGNGIYMTYEQTVDWLKTFIEINIDPEVDNRLMVNLLMPQYKRRVEVEDLDTNFWVIGTVLDALVQALWGNKGFVNLIEKMFTEISNEINILLQKINIMEQVVGTGEAKSIVVNYLTGKYLSVYSNFAFSKIKTTISTDFGSRELSLPIAFNNTLPNNLEITSFKDYCIDHNGSIAQNRSNLSEINAGALFYGKTSKEMLANRLTSIRDDGDAISENDSFTSLDSNNPYVLNDNCHILLYDTTVYTFNSDTSELTVKAEKQSLYENLKIKINYDTAPVLCVPRSDIYNGEILLYSLSPLPNSFGKFPQLNNRDENEEMVMRTFSKDWEKLSLQNVFAQSPVYARGGRLGVQNADYDTKQNLIVQYYQPSNKISESNAIYFITGLNPIITFNLLNPIEVTNINEFFKLDITDSTTGSDLPVAIAASPSFYGESIELSGMNFQGSGTHVRNLVTMHKASEVLTNGSAISQGYSTAGGSFYSLGYAGGRTSGELLGDNITKSGYGLYELISGVSNSPSGNFMNVLGAFWHYTNSVAFVILPNPITIAVKRPKIERITFNVEKSFKNRLPTNMVIYGIKYDNVDSSYIGNYDLLAGESSYKSFTGTTNGESVDVDIQDIVFSEVPNMIGYMFIFYCTKSEQVEVSNLKIYGTTGNGTDLYRL